MPLFSCGGAPQVGREDLGRGVVALEDELMLGVIDLLPVRSSPRIVVRVYLDGLVVKKKKKKGKDLRVGSHLK